MKSAMSFSQCCQKIKPSAPAKTPKYRKKIIHCIATSEATTPMNNNTSPQRIRRYQIFPEKMLAYSEEFVNHQTTIPQTITKILSACNFMKDNG